jgi:hypothetical protein
VLDTLLDQPNFDPHIPLVSSRAARPLTPHTLLQSSVQRPVVLRRLLEARDVNINTKQAGFNATLLHIAVFLMSNPPSSATANANLGPARKRQAGCCGMGQPPAG